MKFINLFAIMLLLTPLILAKTKEEWKTRTVYQLLTDRFYRDNDDRSSCGNLRKHCGGTFKGITKQLSYIKGMGFDAIWISPIPINQGDDYHGYAFIDMYKINPHFGTDEDLKELIRQCHKQDIWVMVDVVANHVACIGEDYGRIHPFNKREHYHNPCQIDFNRMWQDKYMRENCRLFCLPDLDQSNPYVRSELKRWVRYIIDTYGFDGIRIDTVAHVPLDFWKEFADAAGVYQVGEVLHGDVRIVAEYQQSLDALLNLSLIHISEPTRPY
eukprot:TRINITY_DN359_c0_g1_i12.p1 TRINITY_DN359_c0_g1~~TRINITY_DN359_c0_g1_i12.p1  ORF type:complete len:271 (-),score=41.57 TRINITY_DN359_c0_g1_i12:71-883(-)